MTDDVQIKIFNNRLSAEPVEPVEVVQDDEGKYKEYYCPVCGRNIGLTDVCKCGQHINWGF